MSKYFLIGFLLLCFFSAAPTYAFKCRGEIIEKGAFDFDIKKKCGEPNSKEKIGTTGGDGSGLYIERWVYGPINDVTYVLTITGGKLEIIENDFPED